MNIYQRMDIVAQRHRVLRELVKFRSAGYELYYQDETWCNANHTRQYIWQLEEASSGGLLEGTKWRGGFDVPSGVGKRVIVNHIGSERGFLEGCGEVFVGKKDSV